MNITPVLLAGGSGTRLWPLSRQSYPKQFSSLLGEETLFQKTVKRVAVSDTFSLSNPIIMTNADFRFIVTEQLADIGVTPGAILIEPEGRNTAPAVLAAALHLSATDPDAVMLVAPSDHVMPDIHDFHTAIRAGLTGVDEDKLITFGITPDRPETGYGYLELGTPEHLGPIPLRSFVEKPTRQHAEEMITAGNFLWNAGIFLFSARTIIEAFRAHAPDLYAPVQEALNQAQPDLDFTRLAPEPWQSVDNISLDYAVMEHASNIAAVPFGGAWSDLGDWESVWRESQSDQHGVVLSGNASAIDCRDSLIRSDNPGQEVVGIGLENIMVVTMADAVLVADMRRAQDVKLAVQTLLEKGAAQALSFPKEHRPWGWFESLVIGERFQVKRILVHPSEALSLQSHVHRAEHWIVVEGTAEVTIDDDIQLVSENQSVYIPLGAVHRLRNPGKLPMTLIEVQTGAYVGEDDITRYEDDYARG